MLYEPKGHLDASRVVGSLKLGQIHSRVWAGIFQLWVHDPNPLCHSPQVSEESNGTEIQYLVCEKFATTVWLRQIFGWYKAPYNETPPCSLDPLFEGKQILMATVFQIVLSVWGD